MRRGIKRVMNGNKLKVKPSDRSQLLLDRIRHRREQIQDRVGVLEDSARLIRQERESRF
jgi:hypothetical protein